MGPVLAPVTPVPVVESLQVRPLTSWLQLFATAQLWRGVILLNNKFDFSSNPVIWRVFYPVKKKIRGTHRILARKFKCKSACILRVLVHFVFIIMLFKGSILIIFFFSTIYPSLGDLIVICSCHFSIFFLFHLKLLNGWRHIPCVMVFFNI